jgi:cobaltochelatase CobN
MGVIPVFSYSVRDEELGTRSLGEVVREYFLGSAVKLDALIKLNPFFLGSGRLDADASGAAAGVEIFRTLGVPVFEPIIASYQTLEDWEELNGLSADVGWSVAMPEFEGVIEPIIVGANSNGEDSLDRRAIRERCAKLAERVSRWASLRNKPVGERRVAFILHNSPCASAEASVGGAANLDAIESTARILGRMKEAGYTVSPPKDGKELIDTIMGRKAISEFRWTPVGEIVRSGGALAQVKKEEYGAWFESLDAGVKRRMAEAWGQPPGEAKDGMPAAMVYDGSIVVTGVNYGNAVVCAQPKRGCAGTRCDGQVCRILHDPDVPPTHQYLATYRYLENGFKADVLVHVGTHGNLEFLPGKGVGLSSKCYPDIAIGALPHLYIYNSDNPPEGAIAKRRSYACLVDHMQAVFTQSGLYEELEEVDRLLNEYESVKYDRARAHALQHLLIEAILKAKLDNEIRYEDDMPLDEMARRTHEALGRIRNTQIHSGMHVFGERPEKEKRAMFINSILRYGDDAQALRRQVASTVGFGLDELISSPGTYSDSLGLSYGAILEKVDEASVRLVGQILAGGDVPAGYEAIAERVRDIDRRIEASAEVESLLSGMDGRYIPAGPSGLIMRGRDDVLPTGRNFFSLDPRRVPTRPAWRVGRSLASSLLEKHKKEAGRLPENIAYYWMCNDIMWADGEGMAMLMYLLGVEPEWLSNGRLKGFKVIPLEKLGRPRIDVTIRVSGITRDNFSNCIEVMDEAIQAVASQDEPLEMNFPRKHALAVMGGRPADAQAWREATLRIFGSKPGTYQSGVSLAVYASAWKDEKDLSDIYVYWNGYAYGKGVNGASSHQRFVDSLKSVDVTFNKVASDEQDLFVCCCYFSGHGGMTIAARNLSGRDVKAYYGDTRESGHVEVRDLADEVRRVVRTKLLNPKWIEGMKAHGYKGAGDMMKRIGRVYGWEATTREVDDWVFNDIAKTFVLDEEMRKFFEENNPYALEEISRRLLEAEQRELWDADPEVLKGLKEAYLEIEGWMEGRAGSGEYQGGSVDVRTAGDVKGWGEKMSGVMGKLHR